MSSRTYTYPPKCGSTVAKDPTPPPVATFMFEEQSENEKDESQTHTHRSRPKPVQSVVASKVDPPKDDWLFPEPPNPTQLLHPLDDLKYMAEYMYDHISDDEEDEEEEEAIEEGQVQFVREPRREFMECRIAYSPSQFYIVFVKHREDLQELRLALKVFGSEENKPIRDVFKFKSMDEFEEGTPIMALLDKAYGKDRKKQWMRCQVIQKKEGSRRFMVRSYDSGQQSETTLSFTRHMPASLAWGPTFKFAYAIRARLRFPKNPTLDEKSLACDWTMEEKRLFTGLVYNQTLGILVHGKTEYIRDQKMTEKEKVQAKAKAKATKVERENPEDPDALSLDEFKISPSDTGGGGVQDKFCWSVSASVLKPKAIDPETLEALAAQIGISVDELEPGYEVVTESVADKFEEVLKQHGLC